MGLIELIVAILLIFLVWILCAALGLPYIVSLIVTILAALYLLGRFWSGRRTL